jgi:hypothetical protein
MGEKKKAMRGVSKPKAEKKEIAEDKKEEVKEEISEVIDFKKKTEDAFAEMPDEIDDPANVFKLAFLDMSLQSKQHQMVNVLRELQVKAEAITAQHNKAKRDYELEIKDLRQQVKNQRDYIEEKHKIALRSYTYDDVTGVLTKQDLD